MIDITLPMHIFDDRGKADEDIKIDKILFQTGGFILCYAVEAVEPILINMKTSKVLNEEYSSWYVSN